MRSESPPPPRADWRLSVPCIPPQELERVEVNGRDAYKARLQRYWNASIEAGRETVRPGARHAR